MLFANPLTIGHLGRVAVCMDLNFQHVSRNFDGIGASFALNGVVNVRDESTGDIVEQANGRNRVISLVRRLHENVELGDITVGEATWTPEGFGYDWSCTARNWGTGPSYKLKGSSSAVFEGSFISAFDLVCDGAAFRNLMSP